MQAAPGVRSMQLDHCDISAVERLIARFGLALVRTSGRAAIPGSYWGDCEAGLVGAALHARGDTPLHSVLHETGHYICMDGARRATLDTDAGGDDAEEAAVCALQLALGAELPWYPVARHCSDMDAWGYSFRLGSALAWSASDADDARGWLRTYGLIDMHGMPTGAVRSK